MKAVDAAELVGQTLAWAARSASLPAFARIAHCGDEVLIQTLDDDFFRITVEPADASIFPPKE